MLVIFSFVLIVGLVTLPKAWRYDHREDVDFFDDSAWTILPALLIFVGFISVAAQAVTLAGWIASPTAKAVLEIVSMLK